MASIVVMVYASCLQAQPPGMKMPAMPVVLAEVQQKEIQKKIWFSGNLLSKKRANLAAENAGRILDVAEVGEHFQAGETIASFDETLLQQDLIEQQAEVASHHARIQFLTREVQRLTELANNNNAALSQLESIQADLSVAQSALAGSRARVAHTREVLRRMQVVAPFAGVVVQRYAEVGEWLSKGDPIVRLVNTTDLEVTTSISEPVLSHVKSGDVLEIDVGGSRHQAHIRAIVPVGDSRSRLFELRLQPIGTFGYAEQLVRVALPISSPRGGLAVPEDALVIRHDSVRIFVIAENMRVRGVAVAVGLSSHDGWVEVQGELQAGDKVVVRGSERLRDGMEVRTIASPNPPVGSSQIVPK